MKRCARAEEVNKGENIVKEESSDVNERKEGGGVKGQGGSGLREYGFEELDATFGATVWFPELRTEHQYPKEIASTI